MLEFNTVHTTKAMMLLLTCSMLSLLIRPNSTFSSLPILRYFDSIYTCCPLFGVQFQWSCRWLLMAKDNNFLVLFENRGETESLQFPVFDLEAMRARWWSGRALSTPTTRKNEWLADGENSMMCRQRTNDSCSSKKMSSIAFQLVALESLDIRRKIHSK